MPGQHAVFSGAYPYACYSMCTRGSYCSIAGVLDRLATHGNSVLHERNTWSAGKSASEGKNKSKGGSAAHTGEEQEQEEDEEEQEAYAEHHDPSACMS